MLTINKHTADMGTLGFIAPEVEQGLKYNNKCDVYSLAIIGGKLFGFDFTTFDPDKYVFYKIYLIINLVSIIYLFSVY